MTIGPLSFMALCLAFIATTADAQTSGPVSGAETAPTDSAAQPDTALTCASTVANPTRMPTYLSGVQTGGPCGDPRELRSGVDWYLVKERGLRLIGEYIDVRTRPVGYAAYPIPVGANEPAFHVNLEMNV